MPIRNTYGDEHTYGSIKYGASTVENRLRWGFEVDWDNDGILDGANEAPYLRRLVIQRGRQNRIRSDGNGFEMCKAGSFTAYLDNSDGRYDPWNTSSDLYPNVVPGRLFRLRVRDNNTGTIYEMLSGHVTNIQPAGRNGDQVVITGTDIWRLLPETRVDRYGQPFANVNTINIYHLFLGYEPLIVSDEQYLLPWLPQDATRIEDDTRSVWSHIDGSDSVLNVMQRVQDVSPQAVYFCDREGAIQYYSPSHSYSSVLTLTSADLLKEVELPQPWETIRNKIEVVSRGVSKKAVQDVWQLGEVDLIGSGETRLYPVCVPIVNGKISFIEGASLITDYTDFEANTAADGSGTDRTTSFTITQLTVSFFYEAVQVRNDHVTDDAYIILLKFRAQPYTQDGPVSMIQEDATSQATYGRKTLRIDNGMITNSVTADSVATDILAMLKDPHPYPRVKIEARPDIQFVPDLFDMVTLTIASKNIDDDFLVAYMRHEWLDETGQAILTEFGLEPYTTL